VATAGDVNGDGYSDIIVGAPYFDNGQTDEGRVFVFHGGATGLSATPDWTAEIDQANALFGHVVNCAGDLNGDGYSDVVVGAYQYSNGHVNEGGVFVFHGSATGLSAVPDWIGEGNQTVAYFGRSAASAGDVNGDGYSDLIVGAPLFDNGQTNEGRAFIYHGSATGLSAVAARTIESNQGNSQTGFAVSSAGDLNNDGYADVAVGIPFYASSLANDGRVVVHLGSASGVAATAVWTYDSPTSQAQFGKSLACAGDVNGDGYADLLVGAPEHTNGQAEEGKAYVFFGNAIAALSLQWQNELDQAGARHGNAVASAGDVNGDGYSDVLVGVPQWANGQSNEGRALVYLGSAAALSTVPQTQWGPAGDTRVAGAGDVNGDGYSDVIVGQPLFNGRGVANLHLGGPMGLSATPAWTNIGTQIGARFGASVASAGDVNGDGYSDVIIGADQYDNGQTDEGRAFLYLGGPSGLALTPAWTGEIDQANARYGHCVASAGDVNGDGYSDVIIGAYLYDNGQTDEGAAFLYLGGPSGLSATPDWTAESDQNGARFGWSLSSAGDWNGDGYSDVIIGAYLYDTPTPDAGRIEIYFGGPSGLSSTWDTWIMNGQAGARFGFSVMSAGDVNGDGYSDVITGAPLFDNGQLDEGRVSVYLGVPSGLPPSAWVAESNQAGAYMGNCVAGAGDVNGDGYSDVIIAAALYSNGQTNEGRAFLYLGSPTGLALSPAWTVESNVGGAQLGEKLAGAGDVNGDGFSDIVIGSYTSLVWAYAGNRSAQIPHASARNNLRLYDLDLTAPISASNIPVPQFGAGLFTRPFLGRTRTRMVWETRIQGESFSTAMNGSITNSVATTAEQPALTQGPLAGVELKSLVDKPGGGVDITATKVRARVRYDPVTAITGQIYGPWRYMPGYLDGHGTHNNVPLPIELIQFEATCDRGKMLLQWSTASEQNSSHFVVQRSSNASVWSDIGRSQASGHSHQTVQYEFSDDTQLPRGPLYYRLLQVDLDGVTAELPTATASVCGNDGLRIFPNPTSQVLYVDLGSVHASAKHIHVRDLSGRVMFTQAVADDPGPVPILMQRLSAGSYVLEVLDERGEVLAVERVVKE
jgi:hypothetical protein